MVETPTKEKPLDDTGHARKLNLDTNDEDDIGNPPSKEADTSQRSFSRTRDNETNRNSPTESSPARSRKDFDDIDPEMRFIALEKRKLELTNNVKRDRIRLIELELAELTREERGKAGPSAKRREESTPAPIPKPIPAVNYPKAILPNLMPLTLASQGTNIQTSLYNFTDTLILKNTITPELAEQFHTQAAAPDFQMKWHQVIYPEAISKIRMRVRTSYTLLKMSKEEAASWDPENWTVKAMAELIYILYGVRKEKPTETESQILSAIGRFNFGFDFKDRTVEETSCSNLERMIVDHYGALATIPEDIQQKIAKIIYKKLPKHTEIDKLYTDKIKEEITDKKKKDTVDGAIKRMLDVIQDVRHIMEQAQIYALKDGKGSWYSGSTLERQNSECSTDKVISYDLERTRAAKAIPYIPKCRDTAFTEMHRKKDRCDTCGKMHHLRSNCTLFGNPMCNNTSSSWFNSKVGKLWSAAGHTEFRVKVHVPGLGTSAFSHADQPRGHIYPVDGVHEPKQTKGENHPSHKYRFDPRTHDYSQDKSKKPRSESSLYMTAIMPDKNPKLLPVRIFLTPQGKIATLSGAKGGTDQTEGTIITTGITSGTILTEEINLPEGTPLRRIPPLPEHRPIPGQPGLPNTGNTAKRIHVKGARVHMQTGARALGVTTEALLDSGSLAGDFINAETLTKLGGTHHLRATDEEILVCSGLDNTCTHSAVVLDITVEFTAGGITHQIPMSVRISENSPLGLIIGINTIKKYNVVKTLPHFFFSSETIAAQQLDTNTAAVLPKKRDSEEAGNKVLPTSKACHGDCCKQRCTTEPDERTSAGAMYNLPDIVIPLRTSVKQVAAAPKQPTARRVRFNDTPLESQEGLAPLPTLEFAPTQTSGPVAALIQEIEQLHGDDEFGDEGIDYDKKDMFAPFRSTPKGDGDNILGLITISGSPEQKLRIRAICEKYKHIFSDQLDASPAKIPPFELNIDKKQWETYKNRGPVRPQSTTKELEINKQVQEMEKAGIIEKSQASHYSQVMLTAKPNGTWRFCVDYRAMNDATKDASWPIPNIAGLLKRLGRSKADTFGVMDLTSGYHQASLALATKALTAFITFAGVYQFTRLPFGPKRAPSYFQEMMATQVLHGMLYLICEMYLDDCIVYGTGTDEFCTRLEAVFKRLSDKHLFLKAIKCKLGMSEVEYVGKTISKEGIKMSEKQIKGVMEFPKPVNNTQLRSFLGFINYFRDHVPNHSNVVSPLHGMIDHSARKQAKLNWTEEGHNAFDKVKELIAVSPKLYFLHDSAPIVLMTDASDYGVGGYLYQLIDEKKQLIALVSRALTKTQLRWSVIQKEAYGIYFCCTQLDSMLRDRKFTINTDHKNLMFIKLDSNPMVVRWWMALQELDFDIEYIPGVNNDIADALSRLCINRKNNAPSYTVGAIIGEQAITKEHYAAIATCHNSIAGHGGLEKVVRRLKDLKISWPYMRTDVRTFIQDCPCCQKMRQVKTPVQALKYTTSTYKAMQCLNIDFIGPYPDKGYLLVIICTFTRYVEIYPVAAATAASAVSSLLKHFGRYGAPKTIQSDNGPQFVSELIREFLILVGTHHKLTMAYSSEENAIVERCNKEINRHIRALTFDRSTVENYQEIIPFVLRILNSNVNERMKVSPAQLIFGNAINLDRGIITPFDENNLTAESLTRSSSKMLAQQEILMEMARKNLMESDAIHNASVADRLTEFEIDSYVLAAPRTQPLTRMHTLWTGPYRVLGQESGKYRLLDLTTNETKMYHVTQLKAFHFDPTRTDPADIARRDHLEFFIEEILSFKGDIKRVSTLTFHVKWLGYDESYNTWEPWKQLMNTEQLHKFLVKVNLRHLIPRKFIANYPQNV